MSLITHELFTYENIRDDELFFLYKMIGTSWLFIFWSQQEIRDYEINSILDYIKPRISQNYIVSLSKESLFDKISKIIGYSKLKIPFKEKDGITVDNIIKFNKFEYKKINFDDFEHKFKYDYFENLDLPEVSLNDEEKISDLKIFDISFNVDNIIEKHKFLVNNLKTMYYKRAKILHPDKGGNVNDFQMLSNTYEKLLKLRENL